MDHVALFFFPPFPRHLPSLSSLPALYTALLCVCSCSCVVAGRRGTPFTFRSPGELYIIAVIYLHIHLALSVIVAHTIVFLEL